MEPDSRLHEGERGLSELLCGGDGSQVARQPHQELRERLQGVAQHRRDEGTVPMAEANDGVRLLNGRPVPRRRARHMDNPRDASHREDTAAHLPDTHEASVAHGGILSEPSAAKERVARYDVREQPTL